MSLFHSDPDEVKQRWQMLGAQVGGGLAGAGLGLLGSVPLDAGYRKQVQRQQANDALDRSVAAKNWETLFDLYDGKITLDHLPENQREFFAKQFQENKEDLAYFRAHPEELESAMNELRGGTEVAPLFNDAKNLASQIHSPARKPLVTGMGLAGMMLGADWMEQKHKQQNQLKFNEGDLIRLQKMLDALKSGDYSQSS